jgi:hypothetical protein
MIIGSLFASVMLDFRLRAEEINRRIPESGGSLLIICWASHLARLALNLGDAGVSKFNEIDPSAALAAWICETIQHFVE